MNHGTNDSTLLRKNSIEQSAACKYVNKNHSATLKIFCYANHISDKNFVGFRERNLCDKIFSLYNRKKFSNIFRTSILEISKIKLR